MKKLLVTVLMLINHVCVAQNLINNWSFEDTVACPNTLSQIDRANGWMSFSLTPDYFNSCASSTSSVPVSVPHNSWGDQIAHLGNGYAGFVAYGSNSTSREFVATQLNQTLISQQKYFLSYWVSTSFGYLFNQFPSMACNNLGAKFSTEAYSQSNPMTVNNFAHIVDTNIINDTVNWVKISGSFIADSAYTYLTIGNFYDNNNTSYVLNGSFINQAYYYLDDVRLSNDSTFVNSTIEYNHLQLKTYPNPARDWIVVSGNILNDIVLFDVLGNICYQATGLSVSTLRINTTMFADGVYFIVIKSGKESISQKLIIIKN